MGFRDLLQMLLHWWSVVVVSPSMCVEEQHSFAAHATEQGSFAAHAEEQGRFC